jgi:carboxymethylenebutenolidase
VRAGMVDMESNVTLVQNFPAHQAVPEGEGPFPAVIVFHDRFGLTPQVRGVANRLAREGYHVLAPNFYALTSSFSTLAPQFMKGVGVGYFEYGEEAAAAERAATLTDERAMTIFRQALRFLSIRPGVRAGARGVLGFCVGGRLAFLAACVEPADVRACACFYPSGLGRTGGLPPGQADPLQKAPELRASVRLFYGRLDETIRPEERDRVETRLSALGADFEVETYPEAGHDFSCSDREGSYRIRAAKAAWAETLLLFRRTLSPA